jgi:hypothetical protein
VRRPAWHADALCQEPQYRVLPWIYPKGTPTATLATMADVCRRCLVANECAADARSHDAFGFWAGTTREDRRRPVVAGTAKRWRAGLGL